MRRLLLTLGFVLSAAAVAAAQTNYDTSPGAQSGTPAYGSYFSASIDNVNVYNGNLNLTIPLFSLPGRELPMGVVLVYNNRGWEPQNCGGYTCGLYTGGWQVSTPFGSNDLSFFAKSLGCTIPYNNGYVTNWEMNVYWIDGNGTKRRYMEKVAGDSCSSNPPTFDSRTFPSLDGDGSKLYTGQYNSNGTDTAYITYKNGNKRYFRTAYSSSSITYDLLTPNGNYLVRGSNGLPTADTIGRTITFETNYTGSPNAYYERYKITDANGVLRTYQVNFTYPSVWDPHKVAWVTLTGKSRHVSSIDLPNGKTWQFEYDGNLGYLTKVTYPTGAYISYTYSGDGVQYRKVSEDGATEQMWQYLTISGERAVLDPTGNRVVYGYNSTGTANETRWVQYISGVPYVLKRVQGSWSQTGIEANGQANQPRVNSITTILDGMAQSTKTLTYDSDNDVTQDKTTEWSFGVPGPVVSQTDITYTAIATNYKKVATQTLSAINPATGSFSVQGKTEYFYDGFTLTDRGSGVPSHTLSTSTTGRGNLTKTRVYKDATNYQETQMKYDNLGNLIETIDPLSHSTTVDFTDNFTDTSKNGSKFAFPKKVTNPLSQYATSKYDYNTGLVKEITNLRGYTTTTAYDLMGRITTITEPNNKQTTYAYDDANRITTKEVTVDASGNKGHVESYFDKLYRTIKTVTNDPEGAITVQTEYDGKGRVKKTSNPYRSGASVVWTETTYDALDRPTQVSAPDSSVVKYAYSNNKTTTTDQAGNQRRYIYNVLGQLTQVDEPYPTLDTPAVTTYKYYGFGPLYQSNQAAQSRTWVYNWLGQMTSQALPESGTTTFTYNAAGLLATKTDARSIVTTMTYDNANRPTQRSYSDSTPTVSFTYDQNGYTGQRTTMADGLGSVTYAFDAMDRLTQESRTLTGVSGTFSTSYQYNVKGDVTQMTYPSGRVVNFAYATGGGCCNSRLSSVTDATTSTTLLNSITFNAAGGVLTQTINPGSNAINQSFTYNNRLQLTDIDVLKGSTALMDFSYNYGTSTTNTGRVLSRTDAIQPEHSASYVYDSIYRLEQTIGSANSWGLSWTFDTWGNRLTQTPTGLATSKVGSPQIAYTNNRNQAHTYDSAGNTTNDTVHNYAYNAENQQTSMDGGAATYAYDGEGRRLKKVTSTETTYTFYGPGGILCEFSTSTALSSATAATSTDKTIYRTSERTGTAVLLFNTSGTVLENNRTMPYGEAWLADVASANDKRFTTYDRDKESGLDYAMARMYANAGGRFTTPDQGPSIATKPTTLNRYTYGNLDPINHSDQSGNMSARVELDTHCTDRGGSITGIWIAQFGWLLPNGAFEVGREWIDGYECDFPDVPAAETAIGQGGGGPTPATFSLKNATSSSRARVEGMLARNDCALAIGAKNSSAAVKRAHGMNLTSDDNGIPRQLSNGTLAKKGKGSEMAHYNSFKFFTAIEFNSDINWADPAHQLYRKADGTIGTYDLLGAYATSLGVSSLTPEEMMDAVLLHELAHSFGRNGDKDPSIDVDIWKRCK
jgi:RHS repeat-associated protein